MKPTAPYVGAAVLIGCGFASAAVVDFTDRLRPPIEDFRYHRERYGDPPELGYKDLIPLFKFKDLKNDANRPLVTEEKHP